MLQIEIDKKTEIENYITSLKKRVFVRTTDNLLIIMPNESVKLNSTASRILKKLLEGSQLEQVLQNEIVNYGVSETEIAKYLHEFLVTLNNYINKEIDEQSLPPSIANIKYTPPLTTLPVLSEIALTYRCNNKCLFCYAASDSSPQYKEPDMTIEQGKIILDKIKNEAEVPSVSFTGGEPTLCRDVLLNLVSYASNELDMRVNLISNGTTLNKNLVGELQSHGLSSAQISLEGGTERIHDCLTQHPGSYQKTVSGIINLKQAGIFVHTNTTISNLNKNDITDLVEVIATKLELKRFSSNLIIPSGWALENLPELGLKYSEIGPIVRKLKELASDYGLEFFWYSPTPYCLFNPLEEGFGMKSCSACDGLLSISPSGDIKPCSSFASGVGNLVENSFKKVWDTKSAKYWRQKKFLPPVCHDCSYSSLCSGACPLYFDVYGYSEIMSDNMINKLKLRKMKFTRKRNAYQGSFKSNEYSK
ncbi:MAG: PqqD family peptide modification chaperone [Candidatus Thorarchaeota archaeon]